LGKSKAAPDPLRPLVAPEVRFAKGQGKMIFGLFRKLPHEETVARLHAAIVAQSRRPAFFLPPCAAPDTFEGRFEILTLNSGLVLRRLSMLPQPGPEIAQALSNAIFSHFDDALREVGVSDVGVPKKMKKLAGAFMGRVAAYGQALEEGDTAEKNLKIAAALKRNVLEGRGEADALSAYAIAAEAKLAETSLETFLRGEAPFPDP
jgi:cytochrome b pre-mRNA-processing protein 3